VQLDVAVGQAEAQVPADRNDNDVGREAEAGQGVAEALEYSEFGEFSCRPSGCSRAGTATTTVPIKG